MERTYHIPIPKPHGERYLHDNLFDVTQILTKMCHDFVRQAHAFEDTGNTIMAERFHEWAATCGMLASTIRTTTGKMLTERVKASEQATSNMMELAVGLLERDIKKTKKATK